MEKNKENTVPSLDKLYKNYRDSDICEGVESPEILQFLYYCKHKNLHDKTLKNFQNGVETNKEQPKCKSYKHTLKNLIK